MCVFIAGYSNIPMISPEKSFQEMGELEVKGEKEELNQLEIGRVGVDRGFGGRVGG